MFYYLECKTENCNAEFYLNDIPIIRRGPDFGDAFSGPVNHHVVEGENIVEMVIYPGGTPATARTQEENRKQYIPPKDAKAQVSLATYPYGAIVDGPDREELVSLCWTPKPDTPYAFPSVHTTHISVDAGFGAWGWQNAERLDLKQA